MNTFKSVLPDLKKISLPLLLFLLLVMDVKLAVKVLAIAGISLWHLNFRFGYRFNESRLPLFYPVIIIISILSTLLYTLFAKTHYPLVLALGVVFWLLCLIASHQVKLFSEKLSVEKIYSTLVAFFLLNALVSLFVLGKIMIETQHLNPYRYQGEFQKYFINTGDYIKGISFDTSTTNAAINAMGVLFFYHKVNWRMLFLCLITLTLAGSNLVDLMLLACLAYLFLFGSTRNQKSILAVCVLPMVLFWAKISPQNNSYITALSENIVRKHKADPSLPINASFTADFEKSAKEDAKQKIARHYLDSVGGKIIAIFKTIDPTKVAIPSLSAWHPKPTLPQDRIHTATFQHKDDTTSLKKRWILFEKLARINEDSTLAAHALPGKLKAIQQTIAFFRANPSKLALGTGPGRFSSKLAFKVSGLNIAGDFPEQYAYINSSFKYNHLALYLSYFTRQERLHSVINTPNAVYNQMLGEYGIVGICALAFLYFGFFLRRYKGLTYGIPLLLILSGLFFTDYWFEQLSVVILCELLLFLNLKESENGNS